MASAEPVPSVPGGTVFTLDYAAGVAIAQWLPMDIVPVIVKHSVVSRYVRDGPSDYRTEMGPVLSG